MPHEKTAAAQASRDLAIAELGQRRALALAPCGSPEETRPAMIGGPPQETNQRRLELRLHAEAASIFLITKETCKCKPLNNFWM